FHGTDIPGHIEERQSKLSSNRPALPFLYMTGYVGPMKLDPSEHRVVKKPFTIAELAAKVEEVLFPSSDGRLTDNVRTHKCRFRNWPLKCGPNFPSFRNVWRSETFPGCAAKD